MKNKYSLINNPYFFYPFLIWVLGGFLLLQKWSSATIFKYVNTHFCSFGNYFFYFATGLGIGYVIFFFCSLFFVFFERHRHLHYLILALLCNAIPAFISSYIKLKTNAPRPLTYFHPNNWIHIEPYWAHLYHHSFPSAHTSGAFSFFCFLAMTLPDYKKKWGLLFFLLALGVGYSRMYLGAHFFKDIYFGSIIGVYGAWLMFITYHFILEKIHLPNQQIE